MKNFRLTLFDRSLSRLGKLLALVAVAVASRPVAAQLPFAGCGQTITENFDGIRAGAQNGPIFYSTRGLGSIEVNPPTLPPNDGGAFRYRCRSNQNDWAFGARPSDSTGDISYGVRFVNNTDRAITALEVSYFIEQYSLAQNGSQMNINFFAYKKNETNLEAPGFIEYPALNCTAIHSSSQAGGNQIGVYCGNDPANRLQIRGRIADICLLPGETILFRWTDPNNPSNDPHLAIDDLEVTPFCEVPSLTITPRGPLELCQGDAPEMLIAEGAARYEWAPATDLDRTDVASPQLTPNTPGTRTYTVTGFSGTCQAQATIQVTVHPKPRALANATPLAPCPGSVVQLSGSGGMQFSWLSNEAEFLDSPNTVNPRIRIPDTAGGSTVQVILTVTDENGCTDFTSIDLNVLNPPNVAIYAPERLCIDQTYTLEARGARSYVWTPADELSDANAPTPAFRAQTPATRTLTVTGTDGNGCTNTAQVTVTVFDRPNLTAQALPAESVCLNAPLSLQALPADLNQYQWAPEDDLSAANIPNPTVNTANPLRRTYTVTATDANGCTNTASVSVSVRNIGFDLTIEPAGPLTLCLDGPPVQLQARGTGAIRFRWSPDTDLSDTSIPNPTLTPRTPTGSGLFRTYVLVATDADGCESQATLNVEVVEPPTVTAQANPERICRGAGTTLTTSGAATYRWMPGLLSASSVVVNLTETTTFTVVGTDANGCSNSAEVTVQVVEVPNVEASADPTRLCDAGTSRLTATGAQSYIWQPGDLAGASVEARVDQTTTFTVTGTDANGCTASATTSVSLVSQMSFSPDAPRMACAGTTVLLPLLNIPAAASPTLSSIPAAGITLRLEGASVAVQADIPGTYRISASAPADGCPNLTEWELVVRETPIVLANTDGGVTEVCVGQQLLLSASGADRYTWSPTTDLSNASPSGDAILFTASRAGVITFRVQGAKDDPNYPGQPCTAETTLTLTVRPAPDLSRLQRTVETCVDQAVTLGQGLDEAPGASYQWRPTTHLANPEVRQPEFRTATAGTYDYTVAASLAACSATASVAVTVHPQPTVTISPAEPDEIKVGTPLQLTAAGADTYRWEPTANIIGAADQASITLAHDQEGTYRYTVTGRENRFGCTNTASVSVVVIPVRSMNVITPNSDNINDVFYYDADPAVYRSITTRVYDRFGVRLFESTAFGEQNGWRGTDRNGKEAPAGAYHYTVELERHDGKRLTRTGTVTLLR